MKLFFVVVFLFCSIGAKSQCLDVSHFNVYEFICYEAQGGMISIRVESDSVVLPLTYTWTGPENGTFVDTNLIGNWQSYSHDIYPLAAGCYDITVVDAVGCSAILDTCILPPPLPILGYWDTLSTLNSIVIDSITGGGCGPALAPYWRYYLYVTGLDSSSSVNLFYSLDTGTIYPFIIDSLASGPYEIRTVDDCGCTWRDTIHLLGTVTAKDIYEANNLLEYVKFFPNPTFNGRVTLSVDENFFPETFVVEIFDFHGRKLFYSRYDNQKTIFFNKLNKGMYYFRISSNEKSICEKIIVN